MAEVGALAALVEQFGFDLVIAAIVFVFLKTAGWPLVVEVARAFKEWLRISGESNRRIAEVVEEGAQLHREHIATLLRVEGAITSNFHIIAKSINEVADDVHALYERAGERPPSRRKRRPPTPPENGT